MKRQAMRSGAGMALALALWAGLALAGCDATSTTVTPVGAAPAPTPAPAPAPPRWVSAAAGAYHSLALKSDGTLWGWGFDNVGQVGDGSLGDPNPNGGTTGNKAAVTQVGTDTNWSSVSGSTYFSLGLKSDGTLWGWGDTSQLEGNGLTALTPRRIGVATDWKTVAGGVYHAVALKTDGTVWAWGNNASFGGGMVGDGTSGTVIPAPTRVCQFYNATTTSCMAYLPPAKAIAAGDFHSLALLPDGSVWAWGAGAYGALGNVSGVNQLTAAPVCAPGATSSPCSAFLGGAVALTAGASISAALLSDGTVWTWGYNSYGELGDGTYTYRYAPVQVCQTYSAGVCTAYLTGVATLGGGLYHSLALKKDGSLWAWGWNIYGGLGDGTNTDKTLATRVGSDTNWAALAVGGYQHSLAVKTDGTLWGWGLDANRQVGTSTALCGGNGCVPSPGPIK